MPLHVSTFLLCEDVVEHPDGLRDFIGVFNSVIRPAPGFLLPLRPTAYALIDRDGDFGPHVARFAWQFSDGSLSALGVEIPIPETDEEGQVVIKTKVGLDVTPESFLGIYRLLLAIDGGPCDWTALRVIHVPKVKGLKPS